MIKVLIVDDDKLARKGLISLMNWEKYGMQVVGSVQNGKIALEFIKNEPVDLVFVDIDMPEMNGLEFMEQCHQMDDRVQFVVLSFYERFDYVQSTLRLGGLDYISKVSMDLENCDEVLERIRKKYDEKRSMFSALPDSAGKTAVNAEKEESIQILKSRLKSMHWIFDDHLWEEMKAQMADGGMNVRRTELIVSNCIGELEYLMGTGEKRLPLFGSMDELIQWVSQYRGQLLEDAKEMALESDIGRIANTVSYMKENFSRDISTTEAASRIGVSKSYFYSVFKRWVGISFGDYLQQLRIDHAREKLESSETTVSEIAFLCGYNDIYYFSRVFRKAVGCTPQDYRNMKKSAKK